MVAGAEMRDPGEHSSSKPNIWIVDLRTGAIRRKRSPKDWPDGEIKWLDNKRVLFTLYSYESGGGMTKPWKAVLSAP